MEGEQRPHVRVGSVEMDEVELGDNVARNVPDRKCRDAPFAVLYYATLILSLALGSYLVSKIDTEHEEDAGSLSFKFNALQIFLGVLGGVIFTFIWLAIVIHFAECIIKTTLIATPIFLVILAIISMLSSPIVGILLLLFAALSAWYAYAVWRRVEFSAACLKIVVQVFKKFHSPIYVNISMGVASIALLCLDTMLFVGIANVVTSSGAQGFLMFLVLILMYWHNIVSVNVAHVTACGVMGTWFFSDQTAGVTYNSFRRAVTTSFGSICCGALIEAVIRALAAMVRQLERRNRDNMAVAILLCILRCVLNMLGDIVEYLNSYAFVYVALYGDTYLQSAKSCWAMFKSRGIEALVNDDLTTIPLWLGSVFVLCVVMIIGIVVDGMNGNVLIAVIFGLVIYLCCVYTLISYTKTLFVCWVSDPAAFQQNRPEEFQELVDAANQFGYNTQWCRTDAINREQPASKQPV